MAYSNDANRSLSGTGKDPDVTNGATHVVDGAIAVKVTSSGGYTYIGEASDFGGDYANRAAHEAAAVWRCQRIDSNGSVEWAEGNAEFDKVATDLTALSYS